MTATKVTLLGPIPYGGSYTSTVDDPTVARLEADGWTESRRWTVASPFGPVYAGDPTFTWEEVTKGRDDRRERLAQKCRR